MQNTHWQLEGNFGFSWFFFSKQEAQVCGMITSLYEENTLYLVIFSGVYFFTFNMMKHEDVEEVYVYLMHNGNTVFSLYR